MRKLTLIVALTAAMLTACGGEASRLDSLLDQAATAKSQARNLAVDTPCQQDNECSILFFTDTSPGCQTHQPTESDYKIYSLISTTATQAKEATDKYNALAAEARKLQVEPGVTYACTAEAIAWPTPTCVANRCIAKQR